MKFGSLILSSILALAVCSGCSSKETSHVHSATGEWDLNAQEHWHICECGEKLDVSAHTLDDTMVCTVCGSEIWDLGDGLFDVYTYDETGEILRSTSYDANGNIISESRHVYEYDADGNKVSGKYYENDVLLQLDEFSTTAEGETYLTKGTSYQEDGSSFVNEYDEENNIIAAYTYDADGTLLYETHTEYAYTEDGICYESKSTEKDTVANSILVAEYNEYGDLVSRTMTDADGQVTLDERYEREYDDDGNMLWEKTYSGDMLTYEIVSYASGSDDSSTWRYPEQTIVYNEDGTKVISFYGDNTEVETETYYNADGTVERELTYQYETDDDGNWSSIQVYDGEQLITNTEYALSADGWSYKAKVTEYHEDGTTTVSEYTEDETLVLETKYDSDGKVID